MNLQRTMLVITLMVAVSTVMSINHAPRGEAQQKLDPDPFGPILKSADPSQGFAVRRKALLLQNLGRKVSREDRYRSQLQEVLARLKQAGSEKEVQQTKALLEQMLSEYFELDLRTRHNELKEVKRQVGELEQLLEKRKKARKEIIALQLHVLTKQAEGLGFFTEPIPPAKSR